MKKKQITGISAFLSSRCDITTTSPEILRELKRQYYLQYKKTWLATKRKTYSVYAGKDAQIALEKFSKEHNRTIPSFLLLGALSYAERVYLVPDRTFVGELRSEITKLYCLLKELQQIDHLNWKDGHTAITVLERLESTLLSNLTHPAKLQDWLYKKCKDESFKDWLRMLLKDS